MYLINRGYTQYSKHEFGWAFKKIAFDIRRGVESSYRDSEDLDGLRDYIRSNFREKQSVSKLCLKIRAYAADVQETIDLVDAIDLSAQSNNDLLSIFNTGCERWSRMFSLYSLPLFFERFLEGDLEGECREDLVSVRADLGGSIERKTRSILWDFEETLAKIAKEVGVRAGLSQELALCALPNEIIDFLSGKTNFSDTVLSERYEHCVLVTENGKTTLFAGKDAALFAQMRLYARDAETVEVKGKIVSKGIAKGPAKIVMCKEDLSKVKDGDVLIAPMFAINYLIAIHKVAAFVTDEGGATAHASIIGREMKKPCIVGTKHATKLFHDGDIVEVDANKGIVRRFSR